MLISNLKYEPKLHEFLACGGVFLSALVSRSSWGRLKKSGEVVVLREGKVHLASVSDSFCKANEVSQVNRDSWKPIDFYSSVLRCALLGDSAYRGRSESGKELLRIGEEDIDATLDSGDDDLRRLAVGSVVICGMHRAAMICRRGWRAFVPDPITGKWASQMMSEIFSGIVFQIGDFELPYIPRFGDGMVWRELSDPELHKDKRLYAGYSGALTGAGKIELDIAIFKNLTERPNDYCFGVYER